MLQRVQPEVGKRLRFGVRVDRDYAAFVVKFVESHKFVLTQSYETNSGSAFNAASIAPSYPSRNSFTDADTTTRPSSLISTLSETVCPMTSAERLYFTASCWIRERLLWSQEMITRLASSPNRTNSGDKPLDTRSTLIPKPLANPDSASATANPPSLQSWIESAKPAFDKWTKAFCKALSRSSSRAGGKPQTEPRISLAYSEEPNSVSASVASPGSEARSNTSVRPASL